MSKMRCFDYNEYLGLANIPKGSIIDVSSSLRSVKLFSDNEGLIFDANILIDELKNIVGPDGTVMIRAFSWQFCKRVPFKPRETKSEVGALGNVAMKRNDFTRTLHPLYSWMIWDGHNYSEVYSDNIDGFDENSLFGFLDRHHAVQLLIGEQNTQGLTIGHYVEAEQRVPYRKQKFFEGEYYDTLGNYSIRKYSMYVKPINIDVDNIFSKEGNPEMFEQLGIRKNYKYKDRLSIATIDLAKAADYVRNDILSNDGKKTVKINGRYGIVASGVDWTTANY